MSCSKPFCHLQTPNKARIPNFVLQGRKILKNIPEFAKHKMLGICLLFFLRGFGTPLYFGQLYPHKLLQRLSWSISYFFCVKRLSVKSLVSHMNFTCSFSATHGDQCSYHFRSPLDTLLPNVFFLFIIIKMIIIIDIIYANEVVFAPSA